MTLNRNSVYNGHLAHTIIQNVINDSNSGIQLELKNLKTGHWYKGLCRVTILDKKKTYYSNYFWSDIRDPQLPELFEPKDLKNQTLTISGITSSKFFFFRFFLFLE